MGVVGKGRVRDDTEVPSLYIKFKKKCLKLEGNGSHPSSKKQ